MTSPGRRYVALDSWRGIAALLVALFHFSANGVIYRSGLVQGAGLFVDFFFVLSGFVIAANYRERLATGFGVGRFMLLRFGRLYPLHLAVLLAYVLTELLVLSARGPGTPFHHAPFTGQTSVPALVTNLLLIQSLGFHRGETWNTVAWSISTEFWTYLAFAALMVSIHRRLNLAVTAAACGAAAFLVFRPAMPDVAARWESLARCLYGFAVGVLLYSAFERLDRQWDTPRRAALFTALEIVAAFLAMWFVATVRVRGTYALAPLAFAPAVLVFAFDAGWMSRVLQRRPFVLVGTLSYSIYMIHRFLQVHVLEPAAVAIERAAHVRLFTWGTEFGLPRRFWGARTLEGDLFTVLMLAVLIACAWLTYRWIEAPGRRLVRERLGTREPRATTVAG